MTSSSWTNNIYIISGKNMPEICLLSHLYKLCQKSVCYHIPIKQLLHTVEKSLLWHITTKNIYGEGEMQKRLELNNVGPLITIKWKKSNKAILAPITDNLPKYNH